MNKQTRLITQNEYELILKTLRNGYTHNGVARKANEKLCMILICEANLGCRISDVLSLKLNSFQMLDNRCIINITKKKTVKERKFSCNIQFYNFLLEYCIRKGITNKNRKIFNIHERAVQKSLKQVCEYLQLEEIDSHPFRKFFATNVYTKSNFNIAYTQWVLMHNSPTTTLRYIGMEEKELERLLQETVNIPQL